MIFWHHTIFNRQTIKYVLLFPLPNVAIFHKNSQFYSILNFRLITKKKKLTNDFRDFLKPVGITYFKVCIEFSDLYIKCYQFYNYKFVKKKKNY